MSLSEQVIGVGSPIVDRLIQVDDDFLSGIAGEKGGMELVNTTAMEKLLNRTPGKSAVAPGGSAANTLFALAKLKVPATFLGKLGNDDEGRYYRRTFEQSGGDSSRIKISDRAATARCLSLITPDSERTMRTDLGAAALFTADEVSAVDFENCRHAHIEGYLLFNRDLSLSVLKSAKEAGCTVSLDLGSFEVVNASSDILPDLLGGYVDMVMANEDEAAAFCGDDDPWSGLKTLSEYCELVAVKLGSKGALIKSGGEVCYVNALKVKDVKDATGAGDYWAAGFIYGLLNGCRIDDCGFLGAVLGAEAVRHVGADLPERTWDGITDYFENYLQQR